MSLGYNLADRGKPSCLGDRTYIESNEASKFVGRLVQILVRRQLCICLDLEHWLGRSLHDRIIRCFADPTLDIRELTDSAIHRKTEGLDRQLLD